MSSLVLLKRRLGWRRGGEESRSGYRDSEATAARFQVADTLEIHTGCVNRLAFHPSGNLLASTGDDCSVCVSRSPFREGAKPVTQIATGHSANVFGVCFLGDDKVATGAMDSEVRLNFLQRPSLVPSDAATSARTPSAPSRVYSCHDSRVKHLAPETGTNPSVWWSASEDGTLRQFDERERHPSCRGGGGCRNVLVNLSRDRPPASGPPPTTSTPSGDSGDLRAFLRRPDSSLLPSERRAVSVSEKRRWQQEVDRALLRGGSRPLKAVAVNPVDSRYLAVAAEDPLVRVYDRRVASLRRKESGASRSGPVEVFLPSCLWKDFHNSGGGEEESVEATPPFNAIGGSSDVYPTHVTWREDGLQLAVTYSAEHVYSFPFSRPSHTTTQGEVGDRPPPEGRLLLASPPSVTLRRARKSGMPAHISTSSAARLLRPPPSSPAFLLGWRTPLDVQTEKESDNEGAFRTPKAVQLFNNDRNAWEEELDSEERRAWDRVRKLSASANEKIRKKEFEEAVARAGEAVDGASLWLPRRPEVLVPLLCNRSAALRRRGFKGDSEAADLDGQRALGIDPFSQKAALRRVEALRAGKRYGAALRVAEVAASLIPKDARGSTAVGGEVKGEGGESFDFEAHANSIERDRLGVWRRQAAGMIRRKKAVEMVKRKKLEGGAVGRREATNATASRTEDGERGSSGVTIREPFSFSLMPPQPFCDLLSDSDFDDEEGEDSEGDGEVDVEGEGERDGNREGEGRAVHGGEPETDDHPLEESGLGTSDFRRGHKEEEEEGDMEQEGNGGRRNKWMRGLDESSSDEEMSERELTKPETTPQPQKLMGSSSASSSSAPPTTPPDSATMGTSNEEAAAIAALPELRNSLREAQALSLHPSHSAALLCSFGIWSLPKKGEDDQDDSDSSVASADDNWLGEGGELDDLERELFAWRPRVESGRFIGAVNRQTDIKECAFVGTSGIIAAASDNGHIIFWNSSGQIVNVLEAHVDAVNAVQFHPKDCCLATSGIEEVIRIWRPQAETGDSFLEKDDLQTRRKAQLADAHQEMTSEIMMPGLALPWGLMQLLSQHRQETG
uniref:Uncharacterized protein n=1 Tax=Chromera velia CCMP2878 TaxID=1169474 RepID=A0A0G4HF09_9ALVE|eukprot:Cvel_26783.t1-p1 / transcript=Cvel_26783.t1 / gene=Cvel_26783 / organism=Chromera_velia_CCMP2878 / gene_product=WD and tetratricopeptide repeats protein 1, putative / transcript_product=WD and tetratricopeptide repeats protein 1, putative / location=Cvel_scaffold3241:6823-15772(-) / protein_length=1071 / sequence_SO=supercontig / SO=protein_coding / is_pseudo=false